MTTVLIIIAILVVLGLIAAAVLLPRMRERARIQKQERELGQRRERAAGEQREVAQTREREADAAERKAAMAQKEAQAQRAQAELHQERAQMHEQGHADHELIDDDERERFAGTSADPALRERDGDTTGRADGEFEQGREVGHEEERSGRFDRDGDATATDETGSRRA